MQKVNTYKFEGLSHENWGEWRSRFSTGLFTFKACTALSDIMFYLLLHVGPEEAIPNEWCGAFRTLMSHFIVKLSHYCFLICFSCVLVAVSRWSIPSPLRLSFSQMRSRRLLCGLNDLSCCLTGFSFDILQAMTGPMFWSSLWAWEMAPFERGVGILSSVSAQPIAITGHTVWDSCL